MEFRECVRCHNEKTVRQFSLRKPDTCRACMMTLNRTGEVPINAHQPVLPPNKKLPPSLRKLVNEDRLKTSRGIKAATTRERNKPKVVPVKPKDSITKCTKNVNMTSQSCNTFGIKIVTDNSRPTIRGGSASYDNLSDERKRAILKAEYIARRVKEYRAKKTA